MTKRRKIYTWDDRIELEIAWEDTFGEPLPGTREAWPQRVGWLLHRKVLGASPADAAEAAGEGFGCDPSR